MIFQRFRFVLLSGVLFLTAHIILHAQEYDIDNMPPGLRNRAIIIDITARIIEQNQNVVWDSVEYKITIPGRPVELRLVGTNIIISVQFTPYINPRGVNFLLAQGHVWLNIPEQGISFHTSIEAIPMEFDELIYFYPLGRNSSNDDSSIEIQLVIFPYNAEFFEARRGDRDSQ